MTEGDFPATRIRERLHISGQIVFRSDVRCVVTRAGDTPSLTYDPSHLVVGGIKGIIHVVRCMCKATNGITVVCRVVVKLAARRTI